ncbi:MAG: ATP synthase F0 subunit B [Clostridiales bacterium]|nr:ATP synthase F0 subunit B [Clostridiales bacterium]
MAKKASAFVFLLLLSLPLATGAASTEEGHGSALLDFLGKTVNFLLLFGALAFFLAKPARAFLKEIVLSIEKTIKETERARKSAEENLETAKKRLAELGDEIERIKIGGEEAGQAEKNRILSYARQEAERIKAFAGQEITRHSKLARRRLRKHAAELAVSLARSRIEKRMTDELHSRLIEKSIQGIGKLYEDSRSR